MAAEEKKEKDHPKDGKADKKVEKTAVAAPEDEAKAAKKKRLIMFAAIGLLVVGGGAGAAVFLLGGSSKSGGDGHSAPEHAKADAHGEPAKADAHGKPAKADAHGKPPAKEEAHAAKAPEHGAKKEEAAADKKTDKSETDGINFGATYILKPFHLNLGNPLENRYIRLELSIEYKGGEQQKAEIDKRMPQLRDSVGNIASRKSREFLLGPDGKDQLRHEILVRLNQFMRHPIESVFITDMLIE